MHLICDAWRTIFNFYALCLGLKRRRNSLCSPKIISFILSANSENFPQKCYLRRSFLYKALKDVGRDNLIIIIKKKIRRFFSRCRPLDSSKKRIGILIASTLFFSFFSLKWEKFPKCLHSGSIERKFPLLVSPRLKINIR